MQTGAKNIEIAIMAPGKELEMLASEEIEKIVEKINTEKDAEAMIWVHSMAFLRWSNVQCIIQYSIFGLGKYAGREEIL